MTNFIWFSIWTFTFLFSLTQANCLSSIDIAYSENKSLDFQSFTLPDDSLPWVQLFNGKNLDGWEVKCIKQDRNKEYWTVKDGAIVANSLGSPDHDYVWLQTEKEYGNFELRLKFQSFKESPGNSGIQIRSKYDEKGMLEGSEKVGWLDGPQIDIHPSDPWRTGFIYDETRGHQRWIHPDLHNWEIDKSKYAPKEFRHFYSDEPPYWNELIIIMKDHHITTIVNNIKVSDYDGKGVLDDEHHQKYGIDKKGFIALQLHKNDELKIAFKDIEIREL